MDVDKLNIRPQPTTNSTPLGAIDQRATVEVLCGNSVRADDIVWVRMRWNNIEGWVSSRYLSFLD